MDIIKPKSVSRVAGSSTVRFWDGCSDNDEAFESVVFPYVARNASSMFNIIEHVDELPRLTLQRPVTYVIKGEQDDWVVTKAKITEERKSQRSYAEFEAKRRAGNIVLSPLLKCKLLGTATPKLFSASVRDYPLTSNIVDLGGSKPGICVPTWTAIAELECDTFANVVRVERQRFNDVTTVPFPKEELERIMRTVKNRLDSIEPDGQLVTQVVSEANAATWDIATEIGELPETIGYILNGVKQGILLLLRAKREVKQQLSKGLATDISSIWMQYRYAIMPIVYSVNDALDVLNMEVVKYQSFRGRKDAPLFDDLELDGYSIKSCPDYNNRVFLKYKYDVDSSIHQGLQINLAATAWELLPLSFVFDWFFQVGDYLTAAFTPGVVSEYGCQQSVRCKGPLVLEGDSSETINIDIDYYRSRIIKPNAYIGINSDVFISFKRTMDALALSWLIFGKKNRRG